MGHNTAIRDINAHGARHDMLEEIRISTDVNEAALNEIAWCVIEDHQERSDEMFTMYQEFKGVVPILKDNADGIEKANNKIPNDFRGNIIKGFLGYLLGKDVSINYSDNVLPEAKAIMEEYFERNEIDALNLKTMKNMGIGGYGARLNWITKDLINPVIQTMDVRPWNCVFINDSKNELPQFAMRYYQIFIEEVQHGCRVSNWRYVVEWYDNEKVTFLLEGEDGKFKSKPDELDNPKPHGFDTIPLIQFQNNDEEQGDFEKVRINIDSYDKLISLAQNDIENLARSILKVINGNLGNDEEFQVWVDRIKDSGIADLPIDAQMDYLLKNLDDKFNEAQKKTLNDDIFKWSNSVDMAAEKFIGSGASGAARKWQLTAFEFAASAKVAEFNQAFRRQMANMLSFWKKLKTDAALFADLKPSDVWLTFHRNTPLDLSEDAVTMDKLKSTHSLETIWEISPIVKDPAVEAERVAAEEKAKFDITIGQAEEIEEVEDGEGDNT